MKKKDIQIDNLVFSFSENSSKSDIELKITTIVTPDPEIVDIPGCICLFQTEINSNSTNSSFFELPLVSMFSSSVRRARLPLIGSIHAFVLHFDIIPKQLTLPADVFIAATLEKPLISRDKPIP
ncbi:unnamed protein product, partial [Rotaria socialis]